jgi:hypothetical protein
MFAQKIIDSVVFNGLPVKQGVMYFYDYSVITICGDPQTTSILTRCDSVFHVEEGEVVAIFNYGSGGENDYAVIIRNKDDQFISYSNLDSAFVKKRDIVKKGTVIGVPGINAERNCRQVDFMLFNKTQKFSCKKEIEYLRSKSCETQAAYTL